MNGKILLFIMLLIQPLAAEQYTTLGSSYALGRGPTYLEYPLLTHLNAATTKQIHTETPPSSYIFTDCLYTMVTSGTVWGQSVQAVSGVSAGFKISNTSGVFPMSTMTCVAIMYWVYRDTYSATVAQEMFTWGEVQTSGGALIGCLGDLDEVVAAQNVTAGFAYNPNGVGYDFFQGTCAIRNDGKWHHIIQVISRYDYKMYQYIDGVLDTDMASIGGTPSLTYHIISKTTTPTNTPQDFIIGTYATIASKFQGRFDEFMVIKTSSRAFTDNECIGWYRSACGRRGEQ